MADAERLHIEANAVSRRILVLERLAEIALARGQKGHAGRLIQKAFAEATRSWLSNHLLLRLQGLAVRAATTRDRIPEAILADDLLLTPVSLALRTASAVALAEAIWNRSIAASTRLSVSRGRLVSTEFATEISRWKGMKQFTRSLLYKTAPNGLPLKRQRVRAFHGIAAYGRRA